MDLNVILPIAPDDIGVCQLIGVYTMIACWIIPAIRKSRVHHCSNGVVIHLGHSGFLLDILCGCGLSPVAYSRCCRTRAAFGS